MKKFLLAFLAVFLSFCSVSDHKRPSSDLEDAIVKYWGYDNTAIALAIRNAESLDGKWTFRYEDTNIFHAKWVQSIPGIKDKFHKYGWYIISSDGDWQVFYPTALYNGYKGSPYELQKNIFTNAKYSFLIWSHYDRMYPKMEDKISAYNRGYAWKRYDGTYINSSYVKRVMTNYRKWKAYEQD